MGQCVSDALEVNDLTADQLWEIELAWYNAINDALPEGFYVSGDQLIGPVGSTVDPDALDVVNHHDVYKIAERVLAAEIV
jgi:hypothetical protein